VASDPASEAKSVPRPVASRDVAKLPIGALEGYVLSRVDGRTSIAEIATMTGMALVDAVKVVEKLHELGAVEIPGRTPPPPPKEVTPAPPQAAVRPIPNATYDLSELDQPTDIEREVRKQILDLYYVLDDLDHYQLLGISRDASRKEVKTAYYGLAARFHTDRYFGKNLGVFKQKMELLFGRITLAHDTLASKERRTEYDEYVLERDRTRAFEQLLAAADSEGDGEMIAALAPKRPPSTPPVEATSPPPVAVAVETAVVPPPVATAPSAVPTPGRSPADERARREALARRLGGGRISTRMAAVTSSASRPTGSTGSPPTAPPPPQDPRAATDALKRRYEDNVEGAKRAQSQKFIEQAESALKANDLVSAANNYRLAIRYTDDPAVSAAYEETNRKARDLMAEAYLKQARYEEGAQKWREAAISYAKAHDGRPDDPNICERVAETLRREGRDLHRAARFAEMAVQKNPNDGAFRVTLGHVYLDAGLVLRARSELEQATRLAPADNKAKTLLAQARKMVS